VREGPPSPTGSAGWPKADRAKPAAGIESLLSQYAAVILRSEATKDLPSEAWDESRSFASLRMTEE